MVNDHTFVDAELLVKVNCAQDELAPGIKYPGQVYQSDHNAGSSPYLAMERDLTRGHAFREEARR